ncbi:hypothetical protein EYF80_029143 [Liparis tanakae]|uniref:Uncharacterized protein n=1 Tax=Liparis tanakae TaxID=230148 RepID=A0A4Z2H5A9_9TELE|nr:hypothetical protein EYF80_029143 [Liparis tanakae]
MDDNAQGLAGGPGAGGDFADGDFVGAPRAPNRTPAACRIDYGAGGDYDGAPGPPAPPRLVQQGMDHNEVIDVFGVLFAVCLRLQRAEERRRLRVARLRLARLRLSRLRLARRRLTRAFRLRQARR